MAYDEQLAERVRDLVAPRSGVTEKKMFGGIGWMINGNMAVGVMSKGGLIVRIDPDETEAMLAEPHVSTFGREGAKPMKGFVVVDPRHSTTRTLRRWSTAAPPAPRRCRRNKGT